MIFSLLAPAAFAEVPEATCAKWTRTLEAAARGAIADTGAFEVPWLEGGRATLAVGRVEGARRAEVCRVKATTVLGLSGSFRLGQGWLGLDCAVGLREAPVEVVLDIGGSEAAPDVVASSVDLGLLRDRMQVCVGGDMVKDGVLMLGQEWLASQEETWRADLEAFLAGR